ncbi:MAG: hypothetical protein ABW224_07895 [Kibdelosporangium sp.]
MYPGNGQPQQNWGHQQYQGLGYYPQPGSEPPRKRGGRVVVFAIIALVVIIGAVVTIVLVNRSGDDQPLAQNPQNTQESTQPSSEPPARTATRPKSTTGRGGELEPQNAGWSVIKNEKAALIYEVPPSWTPAPNGVVTSRTMPNVSLTSPATLTSYTCEEKRYSRGGLGGGTLPKSDLAQAAAGLAKGFGEEFYASASPTAQVGAPKQVTAKTTEGTQIKAVQVDATVTTAGSQCMATKGKVSVLVLEGPDSYSFLLVNTDMTGGPATPPAPNEAESQKIIDSVRGY